MKISVANRRSRFGFFAFADGAPAGRGPLAISEPPVRSRRWEMRSVRLVGLLIWILLYLEELANG